MCIQVNPAVIPSARHKDEEACHYLINEPDFGPSRVEQSHSEHKPTFVTHVQAGSEQLNTANKVFPPSFSSLIHHLPLPPSSTVFLLVPLSSSFLLLSPSLLYH